MSHHCSPDPTLALCPLPKTPINCYIGLLWPTRRHIRRHAHAKIPLQQMPRGMFCGPRRSNVSATVSSTNTKTIKRRFNPQWYIWYLCYERVTKCRSNQRLHNTLGNVEANKWQYHWSCNKMHRHGNRGGNHLKDIFMVSYDLQKDHKYSGRSIDWQCQSGPSRYSLVRNVYRSAKSTSFMDV